MPAGERRLGDRPAEELRPAEDQDPQWNLCTARQTASAPNSSASTGIRSSAAWISFANWKSARQPHRQEAVGLDAGAREEAAVGDADLEQRDRDPVRVELADHARERVEEAEVGLRRAGVVADELELDVPADERLHLRDQLVRREAGQRAAVQLELDLARDDVDLVAAADDRRVDGVAEHRLHRRAALAEQPQRRVGQPRLQEHAQHRRLLARQLGREPIDELAHDRGHVHGHAASGRGRRAASRAARPCRRGSPSRRGRRARGRPPSASRSASPPPGSDRSACRRGRGWSRRTRRARSACPRTAPAAPRRGSARRSRRRPPRRRARRARGRPAARRSPASPAGRRARASRRRPSCRARPGPRRSRPRAAPRRAGASTPGRRS